VESKDETGKLTQEEAIAELRVLVAKAKGGDASVLPRLREYLQQAPQLWQNCGDLAQQSQAAWVRLLAGNDKHLQECVVQKINALKLELADEDSSALENLLVERVVGTWLQLYYHEMQDAQQDEKSLRWAEFRLKQVTAASDRHTKAIGALATLKKLLPSKSEVVQAKPADAAIEQVDSHDDDNGNAVKPNGQNNGKPNGHSNGHSVNRLAALMNGKSLVASES
jgi:hypothetical protein